MLHGRPSNTPSSHDSTFGGHPAEMAEPRQRAEPRPRGSTSAPGPVHPGPVGDYPAGTIDRMAVRAGRGRGWGTSPPIARPRINFIMTAASVQARERVLEGGLHCPRVRPFRADRLHLLAFHLTLPEETFSASTLCRARLISSNYVTYLTFGERIGGHDMAGQHKKLEKILPTLTRAAGRWSET